MSRDAKGVGAGYLLAVAVLLIAPGCGGSSSSRGARSPALEIVTTNLPDGEQGIPYSAFIGTSGGSGVLSFFVSGGSLPPGLMISVNSGEILGIPQAVGTSSFDVTVMDSASPPDTATATFSLTILAGTPSDHLVINEVDTGGLDMVEILNPTANPVDMGGWSVENWHLSILLNRTFLPSFTLPPNSAVALQENTGTDSLASAPYIFHTGWNHPAVAGDEQEYILYDSTGMAVDYLAINPGPTATHRPSGLSFTGEVHQTVDYQGGRIHDVVFRTAFTDSDDASDWSQNETGSTPGALNPGQAPDTILLTTSFLRDGYVNFEYYHPLSARGGLTPYTFSADPSALPPGISVDPDGAITGVPTMAGSWNFDVTVTDSQVPPASNFLPLTLDITGGLSPGSDLDIKINEVSTGVPDYVEIINSGGGAVDISGWIIRIAEDNTGSGGVPLLWHAVLPQGIVLPPATILLVQEGSTGWSSQWTVGAGLINMPWNGPVPGACGLLDESFSGIDYVNWNSPAPGTEFIPPGTSWTGSVAGVGTDGGMERSVSMADSDSDADWCAYASGAGTPGAANTCP